MSTTLFIGDLSSTCSVDDLEKEFSKFGELADIRIKTDPQTRKSLSYGFVEFSSRKAAEKAKDGLSGVVLCGRSLR
jgi:peptidyl-prolyl cis-trans isomerase-like 4